MALTWKYRGFDYVSYYKGAYENDDSLAALVATGANAIETLERRGAVRRFAGAIERFSYQPIDSSGLIAGEIARRFNALRAAAA